MLIYLLSCSRGQDNSKTGRNEKNIVSRSSRMVCTRVKLFFSAKNVYKAVSECIINLGFIFVWESTAA